MISKSANFNFLQVFLINLSISIFSIWTRVNFLMLIKSISTTSNIRLISIFSILKRDNFLQIFSTYVNFLILIDLSISTILNIRSISMTRDDFLQIFSTYVSFLILIDLSISFDFQNVNDFSKSSTMLKNKSFNHQC